MDDFTSLVIKERNASDPLKPIQSANCLFKFFSKSSHLLSTIKRTALSARYYPENIEYLDIGYKQIAYPMICFCDIAMHNLKEHADFYGPYGIAFSKLWGIQHGIQPIQYINPSSLLRKDFTEAFDFSKHSSDKSLVPDYLLSHMFFIKPIDGQMERNGTNVKRLFTDECEWRYIPNYNKIGLPPLVTEDYKASLETLNKTVEDTPDCWLKFDVNDIKYIIIKTESEIDEYFKAIDEICVDEKAKKKLYTKIIVWDNSKEDF